MVRKKTLDDKKPSGSSAKRQNQIRPFCRDSSSCTHRCLGHAERRLLKKYVVIIMNA
jgi:hypothetical protein